MKKEKKPETNLILPITPEFVERRIYLIRGAKVMLDANLAELYQVPTKNLNLAVRRNPDRFPQDFMFQLTKEETESLRLQIETSKASRGGRRYLPYVFTELGVGMLSSVLKGDRAVQMNVFIIRAFVKLREMLATHKDLAIKIEKLEREQKKHSKELTIVYSFIKKFMEKPIQPTKKIGFNTK